ncbi:MAG: archease [Pseudomonadota bacterium]
MTRQLSYHLIDHTADLGIVVVGSAPAQIFRNAALAVFDIMINVTKKNTDKGSKSTEFLSVEGEGWPDLMVNWLREILYMWNGEKHVVNDVQIIELNEHNIQADVTIEEYNPNTHEINTEIKAVTYHHIDVHSKNGEWEATIIFDV